MPIYEYECDNCGFKFELMRKIGEDGNVDCIKCGGCSRRVFSSVPFIFGGTRWVGEKSKKKESAPPSKPKDAKTKSAKKS
ncbi:MAG: zinc ribbon domain-containing protein [Dehalococcoidia bacterium]|nr:MAG: zinc ribbon domain-containing protein [Dehalococcoidia bacterium]